MTKIVSEKEIDVVCDMIEHGGVVAFPTETVYGLGVKFGSQVALENLQKAKQRDMSKAITLMVAHKRDIACYAYVDEKAKKLIDALLPGRVTLILRKKETVDKALTCGQETIGIRIPDSAYVLALLKCVGPMLVTSANLSDHANTTSTEEVLAQLEGRIDLVVAGKTTESIASTVIDISGEDMKILREGKITEAEIREALK